MQALHFAFTTIRQSSLGLSSNSVCFNKHFLHPFSLKPYWHLTSTGIGQKWHSLRMYSASSFSLFLPAIILAFAESSLLSTWPIKSAIILMVSLQNCSLILYSSGVKSCKNRSILLFNSFLFLMSIAQHLLSISRCRPEHHQQHF